MEEPRKCYKCGFREYDEYGEPGYKDCLPSCEFFTTCTRCKYSEEEKQELISQKK